MHTLIEAQHLNKSFKPIKAVDDLSLQVTDGEIYGLIGPDGAGKTTTLRMLCGGLYPDHHHHAQADQAPVIKIVGIDLLRHPEQGRAQIGYLAQRFALYEDLTVLENIRFFAEQRGLKSSDWMPRCLHILEFVGLAEFSKRRAGQLSGGMKQKLGLAAALVHQPRVLLLDEPTTGVDPVTRQDFWQLIIRLVGERQAQDSTPAVLVSTPYMDEAARCTRIGFMQQGRLVLEGAPTHIRQTLEGRIWELAGEPLPTLRRLAQGLPQVEDVQMFGERLHLRLKHAHTPGWAEEVSALITSQGYHLARLRPIQASLEDVFMSLLQVKS